MKDFQEFLNEARFHTAGPGPTLRKSLDTLGKKFKKFARDHPNHRKFRV